MGRSSMQGTPWHYEYLKSESKSKRCAFNVGHCTNSASPYHGKKCVGKSECEEFARGSNIYIDDYNEKKEKQRLKAKEKAKASKKANTKKKAVKNDVPDLTTREEPDIIIPPNGVKPGDSITIEDLETHEKINLDISDPKNHFVGKVLSQSVEINNAFYKVIRINDKHTD